MGLCTGHNLTGTAIDDENRSARPTGPRNQGSRDAEHDWIVGIAKAVLTVVCVEALLRYADADAP